MTSIFGRRNPFENQSSFTWNTNQGGSTGRMNAGSSPRLNGLNPSTDGEQPTFGSGIPSPQGSASPMNDTEQRMQAYMDQFREIQGSLEVLKALKNFRNV